MQTCDVLTPGSHTGSHSNHLSLGLSLHHGLLFHMVVLVPSPHAAEAGAQVAFPPLLHSSSRCSTTATTLGNDCHYGIALSLGRQYVIVNIYEVPGLSTKMIIIKSKESCSLTGPQLLTEQRARGGDGPRQSVRGGSGISRRSEI